MKVYTETICGMCGKFDRRPGAESHFPPVDWAEVTLTYRLDGSGWTHNKRYRKDICPDCAKKVQDLIEPD